LTIEYGIAVDNGDTLVAFSPVSSVLRFVNNYHGIMTRPNTVMYETAPGRGNKNQGWLVTDQAIAAGKQLTFDYGNTYKLADKAIDECNESDVTSGEEDEQCMTLTRT
jgi:hypothetical protein